MGVLEARDTWKPFSYPWAIEAAKSQQRMHWLPDEVPMNKDVKEWASSLSPEEKNVALNIMLLFTQSDVAVGDGYLDHYLKVIKNPEIRAMLTTFAAQETIHVMAYSHLIETLGLPDSTYSAFLDYEEMRAKNDRILAMRSDTIYDLALTMGVFGAFVEGMQLFASFIVLLNFQRFGRLRGLGQIIAWSVRDETLHCHSVVQLHNTLKREYLSAAEQIQLKSDLYEHCRQAVALEYAFIDKTFEMGDVRGLSAQDVKKFIRYIADRRLEMLELEPLYGEKNDPQPWFEAVIGGQEHANFFEARSTAYAKGSTQGGSWF